MIPAQAVLPAIYVAASVIAAACSWCLVRWWGLIPLVDIPNQRSSHDRPKPRSGGIAIFLGWLAGCGLLALSGRHAAGIDPVCAWSLVGAGAFFLLGLIDDYHRLPEWQRLLAQIFLAAIIATWGPSLRTLDLPGIPPLPLSGTASLVLTVFWYTGVINLFNFMDGTDGIAAGEAALAGLAMTLLGAGPVPLLASAAALGFLALNYPPARLFMGDSGSYLLGFLLAISAVIGSSVGSGPFAAFVLILGTFVADTSVTLLRRILRRKPWFRAHCSHYYQKLTDLGLSHERVLWINLSLTATLSLSAFAYAASGTPIQIAIIGGWLAVFFCGIRWIHAQKKA